MAKIIKLNVYEKTVYAVQVEDNLYIDELGVKHLSPSPENCKNTRNVPPALRTALEHLAKNHTARKKVEDKRTKFLKEISQQLNELEKDECAIVKIPHTQGYVACNTHRSGYLKPTQPSRLGLPLALWFVRIQARCHLCSHNSTWKSFRVAAASGHLTGTAYGQAVKP